MVLLVVFFREFYYAKKLTTKMAVHIFFENIFWLAATFITLYLVKELGIVQAVLVGMLYLGFNLLLSFLVFSDIPRKRDVLVVIGVFFCVVFGTY
ncbi:MAG: hypothetical protein H6767_03880 [Candidatus Peribacteria bacterium]|nr:MAG: hypothetical protein H6767_03880 [Candidatus Peribacteria bacterium]